jgi:hypothetical protein
MEANLTHKSNDTNKGLDTVRARAKKQNSVRLSKGEPDECQIPRVSMQKMRTLKSLSQEAQREMEDLPQENMSVVASAWDWFQRTIGNR